jgi:hypothetical protein
MFVLSSIGRWTRHGETARSLLNTLYRGVW